MQVRSNKKYDVIQVKKGIKWNGLQFSNYPFSDSPQWLENALKNTSIKVIINDDYSSYENFYFQVYNYKLGKIQNAYPGHYIFRYVEITNWTLDGKNAVCSIGPTGQEIKYEHDRFFVLPVIENFEIL